MKKQRAFTLAEIMVVMVIIGVVISFCVPLIVNDARNKIQNTSFYESYRAIYEGAKRAKLNSPTGTLDVYRQGRFNISVCDLFASIYSVSDLDPTQMNPDATNNREIQTLARCPNGDLPDQTGLCNDCTLVDADVECPMDKNYQQIKYSDRSCTTVTNAAGPHYCKMLPIYATQYGSGCDDRIITLNPQDVFTPTPDRRVFIDIDISNSVDPNLGYQTNFDTDEVSPNFTTSNGLTFYGLNVYPPGVVANFRNLLYAEKFATGGYLYRDVYIDTNGKSTRPHDTCGGCNILNFAYDPSFISDTGANVDLAHAEAVACAEQLQCLKTNFGVYKFRLYNNGRVEPITNRTDTAAANTKMRYKLVYVANKNIIDVERLFQSYDEARAYDITADPAVPAADRNFIYWNKNEFRGEPGWYSNDGAMQPECCGATCVCNINAGNKNLPCQYDMDTLECAIIPVIPEVQALPIKTK